MNKQICIYPTNYHTTILIFSYEDRHSTLQSSAYDIESFKEPQKSRNPTTSNFSKQTKRPKCQREVDRGAASRKQWPSESRGGDRSASSAPKPERRGSTTGARTSRGGQLRTEGRRSATNREGNSAARHTVCREAGRRSRDRETMTRIPRARWPPL